MTCVFLKKRLTVIGAALFVIVYFLLLANTDIVAEGVLKGMRIALLAVIPSLFLFYILSDVLLYLSFRFVKSKKGVFSFLFGLPQIGSIAFLIGSISGFPVGAKVTAMLYLSERINKEEALRLLSFANNTGPAFLIGGVGIALFGDVRVGIILYFAQILSAVIYGIVSGIFDKRKQYPQRNAVPCPSFSPVGSISAAGSAMLSVGAFVVFFQTILTVIDRFINCPGITVLLSLFLEIGNAASLIAPLYPSLGNIAVSMAAFAVSFGGISVHMQSAYLWKETGLPYFKNTLLPKLLQGCVAALIASFTASVLL